MARNEDSITDMGLPGSMAQGFPAGGTAGDALVKETSDDYEFIWGGTTEAMIFSVGDETTAITTGASKLTFRMPYAFKVTAVKASCNVAPVTSDIVIDINEATVSILSTEISIDAGTKTSVGSAAPAVISDAVLAADAEISIDFDAIGTGTTGAGVKVTLIGYRTVV